MFLCLQRTKSQTMSKIDLRKILDDHQIKITDAGRKLFPKSKHPYLAIKRILDGTAFLDSQQIGVLSQMTGLTFGEIFSNGGWKASANSENMSFTNGEYLAELNTQTRVTKIYQKGTLFHEQLIHFDGVALSKYLSMVEKIIVNNNNSK